MKKHTIACLAALALAGSARAADIPGPGASAPLITAAAPQPGPQLGQGWEADEEDNICGISSLKRVSKPATVDYDELLAATPQMEEMDREGIDADSVEGKALLKGARILITKTCEKVRKAEGHCSIWKSISNRDGRSIPDLTEEVLERF